MMTATGALADFTLSLRIDDLPASALKAVRHCLVDLLGAACLGREAPSTQAFLQTAAALFQGGPAQVWFHDVSLNPEGAALVNAAAASAWDLDDGHRAAAGHPGASIIPAVLAQGQASRSSWPDMLAALVAGYETACRVSAARDLPKLPTMSTGRWCAYGAAAAAGRLKGLDAGRLAQALGIAGVQSPDMAAAGYSSIMGNQVKEGIPWATLTGLTAVSLAESGLTGPLDILDHPAYFNADKMLKDLGRSWAVEQVYFKPYTCCRWNHAALDALLAILARHRIEARDIAAMEVHTFKRALMLTNEVDPATMEAAQYSLPFCLAVAAAHGAPGLLPLGPEKLGRSDLTALAQRVELKRDDELEGLFPELAAARVLVRTGAGIFEETVTHPWGDPANPFSRKDIEHKFRTVTRDRLPSSIQDDIIAFISGDLNQNPETLYQLLSMGHGS